MNVPTDEKEKNGGNVANELSQQKRNSRLKQTVNKVNLCVSNERTHLSVVKRIKIKIRINISVCISSVVSFFLSV